MIPVDLTPGRMRSRLRKLRRDPAGFAADLPWAPVRVAAVQALAAFTRAARGLDLSEAAVARAWRDQDVRLRRQTHGLYAFVGADGSLPAVWPRQVAVNGAGRRLILAASSTEGALAAAEVTPEGPGMLALGGPRQLRVYAVDGCAALPDTLNVWPVSRGELLRRLLAESAGLSEALRAVWPAAERRPAEPSAAAYHAWIARNEPTAADRPAVHRWLSGKPALPLISILMPVHDPRPDHLRAAISSVLAQWSDSWELCLTDDGSASPAVREILDRIAVDSRVKLIRLGASRGVAVATNAALELATGEVCLFLDHDDVLAPQAVALIGAEFATSPDVAAVYSDEDTFDAGGRRSAPVFKPDFDQERLLAQNYVNHAFAVRTVLLRRLGGLRDGLQGAQDHDLVLRVAEAAPGGVRHVPRVLYHWRVYPGGSTLSQRDAPGTTAARVRAMSDHLERTAHAGKIIIGHGGYAVVERALPDPTPSVLAIVPTRDRTGLLRACAAGLLDQTDYPDLRVCVVDNGSREPAATALLQELGAEPRVRVLRIDEPFNFSRLNNSAARDADADLLLFLNDDVVVVEPHWLRRMAAEAVRPGIGAVGAKLYYPNGRLQHAGVITGLGPQRVAGHEFRGRAGDTPGPQSRLLVQREVSAVTGACLLIERRKFEEVGGFDEALAVAFNDVDLCLRLRAAGYRNLWTPHARLIHAESVTRGSERSAARAAAFAQEARLMRERWGAALVNDPYYNPSFTLEDESFGLAGRSRLATPWA